jgi:hypothetical protein
MPSGNLSVGGTCTRPSLRPADGGAIEPVISLDDDGGTAGEDGACGIASGALPSEAAGVE